MRSANSGWNQGSAGVGGVVMARSRRAAGSKSQNSRERGQGSGVAFRLAATRSGALGPPNAPSPPEVAPLAVRAAELVRREPRLVRHPLTALDVVAEVGERQPAPADFLD